MKKALSLVLTAALMGTLCAPALAAEAADARLTAVTQAVKDTLGLDTQPYEQFYGELQENELAPTWTLNWSGEDGDLNITAGEDGQILSYYRNAAQPVTNGGSFGASLPAVTRETARQTAEEFLGRVLEGETETASFQETSSVESLSSSRHYFSGNILLNGLPSPLSFSISVGTADGLVQSFRRDGLAGQYMGGIPDPTPKTTVDQATKALVGELSLRLEYVYAADGQTALLRYLPNRVDEFYVDGQTGTLVNLTQLQRELMDGGLGGASADGAAPEAVFTANSKNQALTQAELEGAAKLAGALDKEALGKKASAVSELGLSKYTLADCSYTVERQDKGAQEEAQVTARLTYTRQDGERVYRRYVTLDAKSGELISVSSSLPWQEDFKAGVSEAQAQKKAEAFLGKYYDSQFKATAPYEAPDYSIWRVANDAQSRQWSFTYARQANGYFFPANSLNVEIDAADGSVSGFSRTWDETVGFDSAGGIVSETDALAAYAGTFDTVLGYIAVPQKLDLAGADVRPLLEQMGMRFFYALKLGYGLESNVDGSLRGIDAKTGAPVVEFYGETQGLTYSDLEGHWVKADAEALARYGVGWAGGAMEPGKALTQLDLVALLVSTEYGPVDPAGLDEAGVNDLYQSAYRMGVLDKTQRDEGKAVTRLDIVKLLLNGAGYGPVAKLEGIYKVSFADGAAIPAAALGYAALAQGLGIVSGDGAGNFAPGRGATRAEAVSMLCRFLER